LSSLLLSLYSGLVLSYGVVLVWRGYVVGCMILGVVWIFGFIRFCLCFVLLVKDEIILSVVIFLLLLRLFNSDNSELSVVFVELSNNCNSPPCYCCCCCFLLELLLQLMLLFKCWLILLDCIWVRTRILSFKCCIWFRSRIYRLSVVFGLEIGRVYYRVCVVCSIGRVCYYSGVLIVINILYYS
jgi:hypothetical protein